MPGQDQTAIWSPDGEWIAFGSDERGGIWRMGVDRATSPEQLASVGAHVHLSSWSPDGALIAFDVHRHVTTAWDVGVLDVRTRAVTYILRSSASEQHAVLSPDGRWLAYTSDESGRNQIYVVPFPGLDPRRQVSVEAGSHPRWAPNGKTLFFRRGNAMLMTEISLSPDFSSSPPRTLFEGRYEADYDVMSGGQQFAMLQAVTGGDEPPVEVHMVTNWFEDLRRKAADATMRRDGQ